MSVGIDQILAGSNGFRGRYLHTVEFIAVQAFNYIRFLIVFIEIAPDLIILHLLFDIRIRVAPWVRD